MNGGNEKPETAPDPEFEALLADLRDGRGFDFTGYKRGSLRRRLERRMSQAGVQDLSEYRDLLQVDPGEFARLFDTILINVTRFFRDPGHWAHLREQVVPDLVARASDHPLRVWSAGCSSGEEPYTIAMLIADQLGDEVVLEDRLKVYATDVDEDALDTARRGVYPAEALEGLSAEFRDRWFDPQGSRFVARPELRRTVIYGRHDLTRDAPISRLDLLVCRNVLMYFNVETQQEILRRLHFGLRHDGFLFLGKAEMLLTRTELFDPVDVHHRVFRKTVGPDRGPAARIGRPVLDRLEAPARQEEVQDAAFATTPVAQVILDEGDHLLLANDQARSLFGLTPGDLGSRLSDLELSYRPAELRGPVEAARVSGEAVHLSGVRRPALDGEMPELDIWVTPLDDADGNHVGTSITVADVTPMERLRRRLQQANQELETAYEELQSTNEELETTNEELQSTVEELETTNEELQSSNEELETMNEELQSANAEQTEINRELVDRSAEVGDLHTRLGAIVGSITVGLAVVDRDFRIELWNDRAFDLWGVRAEEAVGRSLMNLDIGLDVARLADPVRACLAGASAGELELDATNRRGQPITCRLVLSPLVDTEGPAGGVVILMQASERTDG